VGASLAGKVAIVTGAARGIGAVYARALVREGADVAVADILDPDGEALARALGAEREGARSLFLHVDVTREADTVRMADAVARTFGRIDILVNNAAVYMDLGRKKPFLEITPEEWDRVMAVNVRGVWQCAKAVAPHMQRQGSGKIVNISSVVAYVGTAGFAHYVASKAAVIGLTRALARELGPFRITVNAIAPGLVSNEASLALNPPDYVEQAVRARALQRPMVPEDLVGTVVFLASPASDFVTGQTFIVDGGAVMD
jgi:NAD(P)-dependent dehydrogenase (short-subunit alcohol dehydrogenase family)